MKGKNAQGFGGMMGGGKGAAMAGGMGDAMSSKMAGPTPPPMKHGGHGPVGKMGLLDDSYISFDFSSDNTQVEGMTHVLGSRSKALNIEDSSFVTTVGTNAQGAQAVLSVEESRTTKHSQVTRIFGDNDGDGQFEANFFIGVLTESTGRMPPQHQFTFAEDGSVTADTVNGRACLNGEVLDGSVVYAKTKLNEDTYVVKTVQMDEVYRFEVFRDDDADGDWTEIAQGISLGTSIDATTNQLSLVGIQSYLAAADDIVG